MSKVDELMTMADEWADECAGCDGSHLAKQSTRRKSLRSALQAALVQSEQTSKRAHDTAMRQWEHWKQYALELQERLAKYEGGSPMILNTAPPTHAPNSEPAAYVLMSSYLIDGKAEVSLAFKKPESDGYASVIPLYTAQSTQALPRLTDDQIMGIARSLGWWTVDKEIAADALRLSRAIEATVRKQFGVNDD